MDDARVRRLLADQEGVVSRRQVLGAGGSDSDIERMLRRREWARVHPGVYVEHTGPLSWAQRAWAAVLLAAPAALSGSSALRAHRVRGHDGDPCIEVAVRADRTPIAPTGVRVVRLRAFDDVTQLHLSPPRVRLESALIRVASTATTEDQAVAFIADACQERRTTPDRLLACLDQAGRISRGRLIREVLEDVSSGACSALERRYLRDVERAHGLPRGDRQLRAGGVVRDVAYVGCATIVELDGRTGHEWTGERWADLDRDVDAATEGLATVRAGWRQVLEPCRLAERIAGILVARGWAGRPQACGPSCDIRP